MAKKQDAYREFISKPEISFWVPLLLPFLTAVFAFSALKTDVEVIKTSQTQILASQNDLIKEFREYKISAETRTGLMSNRLTAVETKLGFLK